MPLGQPGKGQEGGKTPPEREEGAERCVPPSPSAGPAGRGRRTHVANLRLLDAVLLGRKTDMSGMERGVGGHQEHRELIR